MHSAASWAARPISRTTVPFATPPMAGLHDIWPIVSSALETIGQMSCNPAIGGVAKGTVVREIGRAAHDAAECIDLASLQFRMLNRSKGPAVWAPRAQCDRGLYRR